MTGRNLAKPFAIAGFVLAEIYMLLIVLAPPARNPEPPPMPLPEMEVAVAPGTRPPFKAQLGRIAVLSIFFGPFGAVAGTGVGLLVSGLLGDFRQPVGPKREGDQDFS